MSPAPPAIECLVWRIRNEDATPTESSVANNAFRFEASAHDATSAMPIPDPADRSSTRRKVLKAGVALLAGVPAVTAPRVGWASRANPGPSSFYANFNGTRLLDQEGRTFTPARLAGRLVLVNFVFTACSTVCPMQVAALAGMQRQLDPVLRTRVHLLSISLDPLSDTPQTLKAFALRLGADLANWTFATGRPQDIERLSDTLRLFRPGPNVRKPDDHSTAVWLIDAAGDVRMRYAGNPPDVQRIARELAALDQLARTAQSR
jgi:cytochrome oxidase Cu insertion factor (SCO1/SenC/PrrC family)